MFDIFKKKEPEKPKIQLPPIPDWKPDIHLPIEKIENVIRHYSDGRHDFAIFKNGTVAILSGSPSELEAEVAAKNALESVFHSHPDMTPREMDDGNILIAYKNNVASVVLTELVEKHWEEINENHQRALATSEVLITPLGNNVFNDFGKKCLFGRCYMFMDAVSPEVVRIVRKCI